MRNFLTFLLIIGFSLSVSAQSSKLKRAQRYMENLDYTSAIEMYNQVLEKEDNADAKINLAQAYMKINDAENAEYWYGQVVRLPQATAIHKLYYGQMLQRNGKCDLAKEWYQQFIEAVPDDQRGQYLARACDYEEELMTKNAGIYELKQLDFNSNLDDMSPVYYKNGLIFASERDQGTMVKREHAWTGNPFLELYYVEAKEQGKRDSTVTCEFTYSRPEKFSKEINTKYHDAAVAVNKKQNTIYFTRNNYLDGKTGTSDDDIVKLKVYYAESAGEDKWNELQGLPFNSDEYSVAHPALTPDDEKLYFASDMPGGYGGMDIYVSEKENGRWGPPRNLGPEINTEGNEVFPYVDESNRLYFSSDGQIGLGGLDVYFTEDRGNGEWATPENMGFPINSITDDFGVIFNDEGTCGYITSDRDGGAGHDDIYSFTKTAAPVQIFVYDLATNDPLEGVEVLNSCTGNTLITGANGRVTIDQKLNECCTFSATLEGYKDNEEEGCTKNLTPGEPVLVEIPMERMLEFEVTGIVFDQESGLPLDGAEVTITTDCDVEIPESITTDASGRYTFKLENDCCYTVQATKPDYLQATASDQCTKELGESETLTANLYLQPTTYPNNINDPDYVSGDNRTITYDPETGMYIDDSTGQAANGLIGGTMYKNGAIDPDYDGPRNSVDVRPEPNGARPFLLDIYYDFAQAYLRDEAIPELEKLYNTLVENPNIIVEIGSHTDSRGTYSYNNRLSQRRAESVLRWLVEQGIERDRLVARGYGEKMNINDCANNIPCSEREHQLNRRTEFRVIGCRDCADEGGEKISSPNPDPRVDACVGCPF